MSRIDALIAEHCPEGVQFKELKNVTRSTFNINWSSVNDAEFIYIDLTSVDRITHAIVNTQIVNNSNAPSRAQRIVYAGDVIFGTTRPMLKRYTLIPEEYHGDICSTGYCVLRPDPECVLPGFIFHLLGTVSFYIHVEENERGAGYPAISNSAVKRFRIPVPPLEVQHEIVKVLDTFTELEARRQQYQYYRDALLTFSEHTTGTKIRWAKLNEVAKFKYGFTAKAEDTGKFRFIRITDITDSGKLSSDGAKYINLAKEASEYLVQKGDILMARTGATCGKTVLIKDDIPSVYASFLIRISLNEAEILPDYYWHFAQSSFYWQQTNSMVSKGGQPQFNANALKNIRLPVPPLEEQARIVTILDKFDILVNDITSGLPAEISARRQQYAYYRDRLLSFQEAT